MTSIRFSVPQRKHSNVAFQTVFAMMMILMEGKISGVKAKGRPRRAWTDDLKDWTELRNYSELKRTAEDRTIWNALAREPST